MTLRPRSRTARAAAVAVVAAVGLSGCSHEPGSAFNVGDTTVTRSTVDRTVDALCQAVKDSAHQGQSQAVPRSLAVSSVVSQMLAATVANSYGDSIGATYDGDTLRQQMANARQQARNLPAKERQAYLDFAQDTVKGTLLLVSIGRKTLEQQGASGKPSDDEAQSIGNQLAQKWARKQGISVNPRYNVADEVRNGVPSYLAGSDDGSLSSAVTSFAKASADSPRAGRDQQAQVPQSYIKNLPPDQRCGG